MKVVGPRISENNTCHKVRHSLCSALYKSHPEQSSWLLCEMTTTGQDWGSDELSNPLRSHPETDRDFIDLGICRVTVSPGTFMALNMLIKHKHFANLVRYHFVSHFHLHADY